MITQRGKRAAEVQHVCDECARATYDTNPLNLSIGERKPTLIICPLREWKIVVGTRACKNFKMKQL